MKPVESMVTAKEVCCYREIGFSLMIGLIIRVLIGLSAFFCMSCQPFYTHVILLIKILLGTV